MSKNSQWSNVWNDLIALFFFIAFVAEAAIFTNIGTPRFFFIIPVAASCVLLMGNTEATIPPGRFWPAIVLGLGSAVVLIYWWETIRDIVK